MSKPITETNDALLCAVNEIVSGISSLNMPADPIPGEHNPSDNVK